MASRRRLTTVEDVQDDGWLFTVRDSHGEDTEIVLIPCNQEDKPLVEAWVNRCTHENQSLYPEGIGVITRDGGIICPKHGSVFDVCSGFCDNGPAADTTLPSVDIGVGGDVVYLTDDGMTYLHDGPVDDDEDEGPGSTSHLRF